MGGSCLLLNSSSGRRKDEVIQKKAVSPALVRSPCGVKIKSKQKFYPSSTAFGSVS